MIRVFHNDTPCIHLIEKLPTLGFDVFNFSHAMDIASVQVKMPRVALMGNVPTLEVMARGTPTQAEEWARECIRKTNGHDLILSAGGGVSPGTPAGTLDAVARAVNGEG
jgi:uroporphyrinogen decarboxylase